MGNIIVSVCGVRYENVTKIMMYSLNSIGEVGRKSSVENALPFWPKTSCRIFKPETNI